MSLTDELENICDLRCVFDQPMKKLNSLGVGGSARYFASPKSLYALNLAISAAKRCKIPYKVIGNGTNLIVSDSGFDGLIISTVMLKDVFLKKDGVFAMCGAPIAHVAAVARDNCFSGLEALSGIPATVGGAVYQNAGAFGVSVSDLIDEIDTLSFGKIKKRDNLQCAFGYRKSVFKRNSEIIVSATFRLKKASKAEIKERSDYFLAKRKNTQPMGKSCGSVFLNPRGRFAGKLIEDSGLKGFSVGGATVSEKHANFITTNSSATAEDVYRLILHIKNRVKDAFGVTLKEEVEYVGEFR